MTQDTTTEAVEALAWRVHESKAGHAVRVETCATLRALLSERDTLAARAEAAEAKVARARETLEQIEAVDQGHAGRMAMACLAVLDADTPAPEVTRDQKEARNE